MNSFQEILENPVFNGIFGEILKLAQKGYEEAQKNNKYIKSLEHALAKAKKENEELKEEYYDQMKAQLWSKKDKNDCIYKLKKENEEFKKKEYDNNVKIARYIIQLPEPVRIPEDEDFLSNVEELWRCVLDFGVDENNPNIKFEHYRNWSEFPENGIDN